MELEVFIKIEYRYMHVRKRIFGNTNSRLLFLGNSQIQWRDVPKYPVYLIQVQSVVNNVC